MSYKHHHKHNVDEPAFLIGFFKEIPPGIQELLVKLTGEAEQNTALLPNGKLEFNKFSIYIKEEEIVEKAKELATEEDRYNLPFFKELEILVFTALSRAVKHEELVTEVKALAKSLRLTAWDRDSHIDVFWLKEFRSFNADDDIQEVKATILRMKSEEISVITAIREEVSNLEEFKILMKEGLQVSWGEEGQRFPTIGQCNLDLLEPIDMIQKRLDYLVQTEKSKKSKPKPRKVIPAPKR